MTKVYTNYNEAFNILAEAVDCTEIAPALLSHQQANSLKLLISDALDMMERLDTELEDDQEKLTNFEEMGGEFYAN